MREPREAELLHQPRNNNSFPSVYDAAMERKLSGTLVSTYDYRQMVYPNSQPFSRDLDRKLTTLEHEQPNEYFSRTIIESPQERNQHICFNLCCLFILLAGIVSLALCLYSFLSIYPPTSSRQSLPTLLVLRNYPS